MRHIETYRPTGDAFVDGVLHEFKTLGTEYDFCINSKTSPELNKILIEA